MQRNYNLVKKAMLWGMPCCCQMYLPASWKFSFNQCFHGLFQLLFFNFELSLFKSPLYYLKPCIINANDAHMPVLLVREDSNAASRFTFFDALDSGGNYGRNINHFFLPLLCMHPDIPAALQLDGMPRTGGIQKVFQLVNQFCTVCRMFHL